MNHTYQIHHLQLQDLIDTATLPVLTGQAHYCVFWWKDIALGELYIESGQAFTHPEFMQRAIDSIHPALEAYAARAGEPLGKVQVDDLRTLSSTLSRICDPFVPAEFPQAVDISVVICTRNRSQQLQKCLESLMKQASSPAEIVVVDNAPTDESTFDVTAQFPGVTYVREVRPGLDIARNKGAVSARSEIVAYMDDDVQAHPHWAFHTWAAFQNGETDATTGLIISSALDTESQLIFERYWGFNKGYLDIRFDKGFLSGTSHPRVWNIGAGANMAFRKKVLAETGLFDERLDVGAAGCNGDSEMWFRLLKAGGRISYTTRSIVFHEHRRDMNALRRQLFSYMRGHTVAALIQDDQGKEFSYRRYVYQHLLLNYGRIIIKSFPSYPGRLQTIFVEMKGVFSGLWYYKRHKARSHFMY